MARDDHWLNTVCVCVCVQPKQEQEHSTGRRLKSVGGRYRSKAHAILFGAAGTLYFIIIFVVCLAFLDPSP